MQSSSALSRQRREERKAVLGTSVEAAMGLKESKGRALLARRHAALLADAKALLKLTSEQVNFQLSIHCYLLLEH